jgi:hypothetical protein
MSDIIIREGEFGTRTIKAVGGLHFIRSNGLPYFTLTTVGHGESGPAHEELVRCWPELQPLADLHLSDINGVPMHAEANGWYWLAGSVDGGFGEQYHGGSTPNHSAAECLRIFADHVRINHQDAADLREWLLLVQKNHGNKLARKAFATWIEEQKTRWKHEADRCIKALGLQVFGDRWAPEEMPA